MKINAHFVITILFCLIIQSCFSQTGSISGTVSDGNETIPGALVRLDSTDFKTITDIDGHFILTNIPQGNYTLIVSMPEMETVKEPITIVSETPLVLKTIVLSMQKAVSDLGEVEIVGQQANSDSKANRLQKTERSIGNVEYVGDGEDVAYNAADNLQKMPAVTIRKDQGEGRFMSVRGTPTNWNSSLINGDRLPVADEESETRTMAFDVISSDLLEYIHVAKALTPDMEGDAIGGAVNFITKSSPDSTELRVNIMSGYNAQAQKPVYNGNLFYGFRSADKKFGFLVNGSAYVRNWGTDNFEVVYGSNYNHGLNRLELRDYTGVRSTYSGNVSLDYTFKPGRTVYFKGMTGYFTDDEWNMKTRYNYAIGAGSTVMLQHIHSQAQTWLYGGEIGGKFRINQQWELNGKYAYYSNRFHFGPVPFERKDPRNGYMVLNFEKFNVTYLDQIYIDKNGQSYSIDANGNPIDEHGNIVTDPTLELARVKLIGADNPRGNGDPWDNIQPVIKGDNHLEDYEFSGAYTELNTTWERDPFVAALNTVFTPNERLTFQAGIKARYKEGFRSLSLHEWHQNFNTFSDKIALNSFNTSALNLNGGFMEELGQPWEGTFIPFLNPEVVDNLITHLGDTLREEPMTVAHHEYYEFVGSTYSYKEATQAGYLMLDYQFNKKWSLIGGIRLEATQLYMSADTVLNGDDQWYLAHIYDVPDNGYQIVPVDNDPYASSGYDRIVEYTVAYPVKKVELRNNYLSPLPMLHLRFDANSQTVIRSAITRTFRRPNFIETKPGAPVIDFTNLEYNLGNGSLRPSYSWNFDFSYEYYMKNAGLASIGLFGKRIEDHIYRTITADIDPQQGIIYKSYQNATTPIYLTGVEVNLKKQFDFLNGIWQYFGVDMNFTYTHSRMQIPGRSFSQSLPMQPSVLFNGTAFFEKERFKLTAAINYTGKYLMEVNTSAVLNAEKELQLLHDDTEYDVFMRQRWGLDLSASWKLNQRMQLYSELSNLLNTPFYIYRGQEYRPMQVEYYSVRATLGMKFIF